VGDRSVMEGADYNKLEKKKAAKDGAALVKNSGRGMNKGDAKTDQLLIDYKFTGKNSYSINHGAWRKHELDAVRCGREPVIVAIFTEHKDKSLAIVDWEYLKELMSHECN
jgi:hypothetical protein